MNYNYQDPKGFAHGWSRDRGCNLFRSLDTLSSYDELDYSLTVWGCNPDEVY